MRPTSSRPDPRELHRLPGQYPGRLPERFGRRRHAQLRPGATAPTLQRLLNRVALYNLNPPEGVPPTSASTPALGPGAHLTRCSTRAELRDHVGRAQHLQPGHGARHRSDGLGGARRPRPRRFRYPCLHPDGDLPAIGAPFGSAPIRPFLTNPMDCGNENGGTRVRLDSYEHPGSSPRSEYGDPLNVNGCEDPRFRFEPESPCSRPRATPAGPPASTSNL